MKYFKILIAWGIMSILCSTAWADIPNLINFQGILDSAGNPLANKTVSVEFRIYDAASGGNVWWSETQSITTNANGVFNVLLGFSNAIPETTFSDSARWLGIKVASDAEMMPRQKLVSFVYGYRVSTVEGAKGGTISGNTAIQSDLTVSGKVGIGTTSPQGALDVSSTTGALIVPRMTTAQRNALTAVNGMIIYNTSDNQFNFYENGAWVTK